VSGQIPRPTGSIVLITVLLTWGMGMGETADTARADDCLAAPSSAAPKGGHWYYRLDRASQRKCWYLRPANQPARNTAVLRTSDTASPAATTALEEPAIDSTGVQTSVKPGDSTVMPVPHVEPQHALVSAATTAEPTQKSAKQRSPAPSIKPATVSASAPMPTVPDNSTPPPLRGGGGQSAPTGGATTVQPVHHSAQNGTALSSVADAPAAQPSLSPQVNDQGGAPTLPAWPNSPTGVDKMQEPTGPSDAAQGEAVRPTKDAKAPTDVEGTAEADTSTTSPGVGASLASTPVAIFPIAALGLVVAGFLLRIVLKIFVGRRHRVTVDHRDFDGINDRHGLALPDDEIVDQRDGLGDYLRRSNKSVASKSGSRRPSQINDERINDAPDRVRLQIDKIGKRERRSFGVDPHESEWIDTNRRQSKRRNDEQCHESIGIDPREPAPIDDQHQQGWRYDHHQRGSVAAADELIDDLQNSLLATPSDYRPRPPFQGDLLNEGDSRHAASADEIREREEGLEQLKRSLDRLLQSPNVA